MTHIAVVNYSSLVLALFLSSCTTTTVSGDPVKDACSAKADENAVLIDKVAKAHGVAATDTRAEFMNACVAQLESDLDQVTRSLESILDAGKDSEQ